MGKISTIMRLDYVINQLSVYNYQYKLRWYRGHISSSFVIQDELFIYKEDIMENTVLYFYNGKYYTLRQEIKNRRQYYITLVEVDLDGNDTSTI